MDINMDELTGCSDKVDKSWDHPWCTEEIRKHRREWSLAGDAGLLKYLQRFSDNLTMKANETQRTLDSLMNCLNETSIFVDNLTNTSLTLANTQFIESRVYEDDVKVEKPTDHITKNTDQELNAADIIANVNESIKEGLRIVDENYDKVELVVSDSEDESENALLSCSTVLRPKDPYQDRPLPYVIGSEKWEVSSKIGLEFSSSESEQMEEEGDESSSDSENKTMDFLNTNNRQNTCVRLSSTSSESNDYNLNSSNSVENNNSNLKAESQDTLNLESEPVTPISELTKSQKTINEQPTFAEEVAKRLGKVLPSQKAMSAQKINDSSTNNVKDDLLPQEDDEGVFSNICENLFSKNELYNESTSASKWSTLSQSEKVSMIPSNVDVPPPIGSISTKSKSAFDDLFGDADSEDSDDIFSEKGAKKRIDNTENRKKIEIMDKKYLSSDFVENMGNITADTSETHDGTKDLFADEEFNEDDLFKTLKSKNNATSEASTDINVRKKPIGGVSVLHGMEVHSPKLLNKVFRQCSSESSSSETASFGESQSNRQSAASKAVSNENFLKSSTMATASSIGDLHSNLGNSTDNNEISTQFPNTKNIISSRSGVDFQPQTTSSRLQSEEYYRERNVSDSLYVIPTQESSINVNLASNNPIEEDAHYQNIFDDIDVFGPPPLPKGGKKPSNSKKISLFDDSESDDDLFFNAHSESRVQKSADTLTTSQVQNKLNLSKNTSIFNDDNDIFEAKDFSDVDTFTVYPKTVSSAQDGKNSEAASDLFGNLHQNDLSKIVQPKHSIENSLQKSVSLFDDNDEQNDLFGSNLPNKGSNVPNIFADMDLANDSLKLSTSTLENYQAELQGKTKVESVDKVNEVLPNIFSDAKTDLFNDDDDGDNDLFQEKASLSSKVKEISIQSKTEFKDSTIFKSTISSENIKVSNQTKEENKNKIVIHDDNTSERDLPKTLNIQSSTSSTMKERSQVSCIKVSDKIKDLMGKMDDLKILSPTDTPPVLGRSKEKHDREEDHLSYDNEDGISSSVPSSGTETIISVENISRKEFSKSILTTEKNTEGAISFDEPIHVETLTTASKSRVRIPVKRRPQSRHARQTALRQSGIDFDVVNSSEDLNLDNEANIKNKSTEPSDEIDNDSNPSSERLITPTIKTDKFHVPKDTELNISLALDDKSERSLSANKNTLLSPSTDEEDLFDVPPDLPEDPFKEDSLFGRAPILSPVSDVVTSKNEKSSEIKSASFSMEVKVDKKEKNLIKVIEKEENVSKLNQRYDSLVKIESTKANSGEFLGYENKESFFDPLCNSDHDPLKDPSQLFAFVTKTPSPEKGKALSFNEDDSLFSNSRNEASNIVANSTKKIDLLLSDADSDSFSVPLVKPGKKLLKDTKISLFDDDVNEDEDSLFGSKVKKYVDKNETQRAENYDASKQSFVDQYGIFSIDSEDYLFSDRTTENVLKNSTLSENKTKASNLQDIFGDKTSEEDIFGLKKAREKKSLTEVKSLFNDCDDDIFGMPSSSKSKIMESQSSTQKIVKRDLKKTTDQIVEDPLRMLLED